MNTHPIRKPSALAVQLDLDHLHRLIRGKNIGVITNISALVDDRNYLLHKMVFDWKVKVKKAFAPEHGLWGVEQAGKEVKDSVDRDTGVKVVSLYNKGVYKPTQSQLRGIDALVFCMQGTGIRYWTFDYSMSACMEAAKEKGIPFIVVDRPAPIRGDIVEGNLLEEKHRSILSVHPLAFRHGMTPGELARYYNGAFGINADLHVVPLKGWQRNMWFEETGMVWNFTGPNVPTIPSVLGYGCTGLFQGVINISVGRGTTRPFELIGAPWLEENKIAAEMNSRGLAGVTFIPVKYRPTFDIHNGKVCRGVLVNVANRDKIRVARVALHLLEVVFAFHKKRLKIIPRFDTRAGTNLSRELFSGCSATSILKDWDKQAEKFRRLRRKYLIYS